MRQEGKGDTGNEQQLYTLGLLLSHFTKLLIQPNIRQRQHMPRTLLSVQDEHCTSITPPVWTMHIPQSNGSSERQSPGEDDKDGKCLSNSAGCSSRRPFTAYLDSEVQLQAHPSREAFPHLPQGALSGEPIGLTLRSLLSGVCVLWYNPRTPGVRPW